MWCNWKQWRKSGCLQGFIYHCIHRKIIGNKCMHNYSSLLASLSLLARTVLPVSSRLLDRQHSGKAHDTVKDGKASQALMIHHDFSDWSSLDGAIWRLLSSSHCLYSLRTRSLNSLFIQTSNGWSCNVMPPGITRSVSALASTSTGQVTFECIEHEHYHNFKHAHLSVFAT